MTGSKHIPQQRATWLSKGKGRRDLNCPRYDECLSFAAKQYWSSFNCESCPDYKPATTNGMAGSKKANRNGSDASSSKPKGLDRLKDGKPDKKAPKAQLCKLNATVTIDFTEHPEALKRIKKSAKKQGRLLETELIVIILVDLATKDPGFYDILKHKAK